MGVISIMNNSSQNSKNGTDNKKGTFLVKVNKSESGTWQGNVLWADGNRSEHFRSALELLNLIEEAINDEAV